MKVKILFFATICMSLASCSEFGDHLGSPLNPSPSQNEHYPQTDLGKTIKSYRAEKIVDVLWDTTFNVTKGLDYFQMNVLTDAGQKLDIYLLKVDPSKGLDLKVGVSKKTTSESWHEQVLSEMAAEMSTLTKPVYAMVNADYCDNRKPIRPRGPAHCNGKIIAEGYSQDPYFAHQGLSYVGVTYDGKMTIGPNNEYEDVKSTLKECTGGGMILLMDSVIYDDRVINNLDRDPRTAIGYTSDGIVWVFAVDGRHKGTEGMTYGEMASIFKSLGCTAAVNLDGGGSTEMVIREPITRKIKICNWPSDPTDGDGGVERPRPDTWAIVKK